MFSSQLAFTCVVLAFVKQFEIVPGDYVTPSRSLCWLPQTYNSLFRSVLVNNRISSSEDLLHLQEEARLLVQGEDVLLVQEEALLLAQEE